MRALITTPSGTPPLELAEVAELAPADSEAVVAVRAVSLNRGEVRNLAARPVGSVPGWDVAGEVARAAADGTGPPVGARVVGLVAQGAWAERVAVPTTRLAEIPDDLTFTAAATLPVAGITALLILRAGELVDDRRVLVTGAAGGVGHFAVQLAAQEGASVTAVVGSPERGVGLAELGATEVCVGFPEGREFDLILESVGGSSLASALGSIAPNGVIVSFGSSSGETTTFEASSFYRKHGARVRAFVIFAELERSGSTVNDLRFLAAQATTGRLVTEIGVEASWQDAARVVSELLDRRVRGKAVLLID